MCNDINVVRLGFTKQPKLTKDQPIVNYFIFLKTVDAIRTEFSTVILNHIQVLSKTPYDSNESLYSLLTLCGGAMSAMTSRPYGWGLRNIAKIDQEIDNCELFNFFKKNVTIRTKHSTAILHFLGDLCVH